MKWAFSAVVISLSLFLSACSSDDNLNNFFLEPAQIRFVNLVSDSPTLIYDLNGGLLGNVSYAQSSALRNVNQATYLAVVSNLNAAGTTETVVNTNEELGITTGREYSVVATGTLESPIVTILDVAGVGEIAAGSSEIHFFNGSSLAAGIDVYLSEDLSTTSVNGLSPISVGANASSAISTVDSGERRLLVTASGDGTVIYDGGVVDLPDEGRHLFAAIDSFGVGGNVRMIQINAMTALGLIDERFPANFRVANMIADVAAIDVNLDAMPEIVNLGYEQISDYVETDTNLHQFAATLVGQPTMVLHEESRRMVAGESRTLIVAGSSDTDDVQGRFLSDERRSIATAVQMRIVNAAADAGTLDVYILEPDQLVTATQPSLSDFTLLTNGVLLLEGGEYDVAFTQANETTVLVGPERITVSNGGIYSLFLSDADGGGVPGEVIFVDESLE